MYTEHYQERAMEKLKWAKKIAEEKKVGLRKLASLVELFR